MRKGHGWAVGATALALVLAGCGDDKKDADPTALRAVEVVAETDASRQPLDAVPSPDGSVIYVTTAGDAGGAVHRVTANGGPLTTLFEGAPFTRPTGVSASADGVRLFVADGAILNFPVVTMVGGSGEPGVIPGTEGTSARGLDVVGDDIYFTGKDPARGRPGLFRISASGGAVETVAAGEPFVAPDSVVVDDDEIAYVTDQGTGPGNGLVFRVAGGKVTPLLTGLRLGSPAGVTLINDEATLLVSSVDTATRSNQVLFLQLESGETATRVIGDHLDSSGGLHRAHDADVLAWADVQRPGRVYRVDP